MQQKTNTWNINENKEFMKNQISKNFHYFIIFFYLLQVDIGKFINYLLGYKDVENDYHYIWEYTWFRIFVFAVPIMLVLIYRLFLHGDESLTKRNRAVVYVSAVLAMILDLIHLIKLPVYMYLISLLVCCIIVLLFFGRITFFKKHP